MPSVFLSPSTQEFNPYINGGNEEQYMNLIADAMVPYLLASGIEVGRNDPDEPLSAAIAASNAGDYDFHLAIHSNSSPESIAGQLRGPDVYYYATSERGRDAATIIANNMKWLYPDPSLVNTVPNTTLAELRRVTAPSVLIEVAYHDNYADARWIEGSLDVIAQAIARGLCDYFGLPFLYPQTPREGIVATAGSPLLLRAYPGIDGEIIGRIPNGASVEIYASYDGWYSVRYGETLGYAAQAYILA